MPDTSATPVQGLIPDFVNLLLSALAGYGVPTVFVGILATLFALESWYAYGRRIVSGARTAGGFLGRASGRVASRHWARAAVATVSTLVVLVLQGGFVAVSYVGGSYLAAPFDPDRTDRFFAVVESQPFGLFQSETATGYLELDWIAAAHLTVISLALLASYRKGDGAWLRLATFPYPLMAFGGAIWVLLLVALDLLTNLVRWDFTGPDSWPAVRDGNGGIFAVGLFALAYTLAWLATLYGSEVVKRHWREALREDLPPSPEPSGPEPVR